MLRRRSRHFFGLPCSVNEHEVARVDQRTNALSRDKNRIPPIDRVGERNEPADQTHIPEHYRHPAFRPSFRCDPLDEPPAKKKPLAQEAYTQPYHLCGRHGEGVTCHGICTAKPWPASTGQRTDRKFP